ncbi:NHLP bacteriocin export ABC transporter permease/ATPase subunit [Streptomyces sp. NBC_00448]
MGGLGRPVPPAGRRSLSLEGPHVLWLVARGAMDLFAVDAARQGRWHFLGRLRTGTLLLGPADGPQHTLVARPLEDCVLHRIALRELFGTGYGDQAAQGGGYGDGSAYGSAYGDGSAYGSAYGDGWAESSQAWGGGPLENAFARGIGRGLSVLFDAPVEGRPAPGSAPGAGLPGDRAEESGSPDDGILWMPVAPGSVQYAYGDGYGQGHADAYGTANGGPYGTANGGPYQGGHGGEPGGDLLVDSGMWRRMVEQQTRLLFALDRWIEQSEQAHEDRAAAGIKAGEEVREQADHTLLASIGKPGPGRSGPGRAAGSRGPAGDDGTLAACRLVADAAGIDLGAAADGGPGPEGADAADRMSAVERIAVRARLRTRPVQLNGRWWRENSGPLVGHRAAGGAPVALLWRRGGYEAVTPATGRRATIGSANAAEFAPRAVMFYHPLPEEPLSARRLLGFCLRGTGADLRALLLGGLVAVGLGALVPIATGRVLGEYVPNAENSLIVQTALAIVATTVVSTAFMLMQNTAILRVEGRVEATLQPAVWDRLLRLPTRFFAERSTGELASAAMGISAIRRVLSGISSVIVQAGTVGAVNLVLLLWFSVPLTLVAVALLLVVGAVFLGLGLAQLRWQRKLVVLTNKLNNLAFQTLRGLPKLRVSAAESFAYAAWAGEFAHSRELQQRVGRTKNLITVFNSVCLPFCTLTMFMLLAGPARGALSPGAFLTFNTAVTMMLTSVTQLTGALLSAAAVLPLFEQVKPILEAAPEVRGGSTQPGTLSGAIEARNLTFRYADDAPLVLDDVSFRVRPGEFTAIVGASGCGKSTLLRLLIGFDRPVSGGVHYDGQDLAALDQSALRRQCGVVLQNAQPFTGSILDCIRGAGAYTLEEAWQAARLAGLAEDIKQMPMGMHTVLSDGGGAVSGGQRQRLMIAQALIRRPRILFFDEATSALDNETQGVVMESTRALRATRVVIAHRLSTIMDADRVIVMADGRVAQQGPPTELLADTGGLFHRLVRRQLH